MLEINQISFSYKNKEVLKDLSLSIKASEVYGIVGKNGAGKTTFFNVVAKQLNPSRGNITYYEQGYFSTDIAFLETENFFYPYMKGKEFIQLLASDANFPLQDWNYFFQLPLNDMVDNYSTGMKKKLAFIGVIALNRPILILDEPFNGLDLTTCELVYRVIKRLKIQGKLILISSHIVSTLTAVCDSVSILKDGAIHSTYEKNNFDCLTVKITDEFDEEINNKLNILLN